MSSAEGIKSLNYEQLKFICGEGGYTGRGGRKEYLEHLAKKACEGEQKELIDEFVRKVLLLDATKPKVTKVDPLTEEVFAEMNDDDKKEHGMQANKVRSCL